MHEATTQPGPYSWEDFIALDEDDLRELIDGELVEVEVPRVLPSGYEIRISQKRIVGLLVWALTLRDAPRLTS